MRNLIALMLAVALSPAFWGTPVNAQTASTSPKPTTTEKEKGYFFNYWQNLKRDIRWTKETCATAKLAQESGATPYQKLNHWVACAQLPFTGNVLAVGLGQAPPGNGFGVALTTMDDQALNSGVGKPGIPSKWKIHSDVSNNASWTSYFLWILKPDWSTHQFRAPAFRFFAGSQMVNSLPYLGEGEQTSTTASVNYALQRTAFGGMADATLVHKPLGFAIVLHMLAAENLYSLSDGPAPGLSTLPASAMLFDAPSFFQQAVGADLKNPTYNTGALLQHSDAVHIWLTNRHSDSGSYSFRQWSGSWTHTIQIECVLCPSLEFHGAITETIADAGNSAPFFLEPTIGGSDINNNLAIPGYADYRFRAPNTEYGYALVREPLIVKGEAWPIDFVARADSGKPALTRDALALDHLRHSWAAGLDIRAGDKVAIYLLFAWGPEGTHIPIVKVNPDLFGQGITSFW